MASVSAIIVTRGDHDMEPILESLPDEWEKIVWNNGKGFEPGATVKRFNAPRSCPGGPWDFIHPVSDMSVYGRYAAIEYAAHDLIYVQDDDCIVRDPQAIVDRWRDARAVASDGLLYVTDMEQIARGDHLVANMPPEFRHKGYTDSCLVGFGACFHRDLPESAFERILGGPNPDPGGSWTNWRTTLPNGDVVGPMDAETFRRTCDVWFTTLTPRVLVDVPVERLPYAFGENRMYNQPGHVEERTQVLQMARKVRDA